MIKLIDILEDINEANGNFILPYKMGGINVTGDEAWNKWKILLDRNRRDDFVYKILDSIKRQNYITFLLLATKISIKKDLNLE